MIFSFAFKQGVQLVNVNFRRDDRFNQCAV